MNIEQAKVGTGVVALRDFSGVPKGTLGMIDEDYGTGVMVAWDLQRAPLPAGYKRYDGKLAVQTGIVRDGFDKMTELEFLDVAPLVDPGLLERIGSAFVKMLEEKGTAHTLEYIAAIEGDKIDYPPVPVDKATFLRVGRTTTAMFIEKKAGDLTKN